MNQEFLKQLREPHLLMSRLKNFCTVTFWDFKPTRPEQFEQVPADIKVSGQYVDVGELDKMLQKMQHDPAFADLFNRPVNEIVRFAVVELIRTNDVEGEADAVQEGI